jgi:hypothetical protein
MNKVSAFMKILVLALYLRLLVKTLSVQYIFKNLEFLKPRPSLAKLKFCSKAWIQTYKHAFLEQHKIRIINGILLFLVLQCSSSNKALLQIYNRKSQAFFLRGLRDFRISEKSANFLNKTSRVR